MKNRTERSSIFKNAPRSSYTPLSFHFCFEYVCHKVYTLYSLLVCAWYDFGSLVGHFLISFWDILVPWGSFLAPLGLIWDPFWAPLAPFWHPGCPKGSKSQKMSKKWLGHPPPKGSLLGPLGQLWGAFGRLWVHFGIQSEEKVGMRSLCSSLSRFLTIFM